MKLSEAKAKLCKLLCCNIDNLSYEEVKKLKKKRTVQWHPDKNHDEPDRYKEHFLALMEAWDVYNERYKPLPPRKPKPSTSRKQDFDFKCYESMPSSSSSEDESQDYNDTCFDDEFFQPSPEKSFAIPPEFRDYFRSNSNRRAGKTFVIFTVWKHESQLKTAFYNYFYDQIAYFGMYAVRTDRELIACVLSMCNEYRLGDIKKRLRFNNIIPNETIYAVKLEKLVDMCKQNYNLLFEPNAFKSKKNDKKPEEGRFNHKLLCEFAEKHEINDVYELLFEYAHLSKACDRNPDYTTPEHEEDHNEQIYNAQFFVHLSDRKRAAKNAIDAVTAKLYMRVKSETSQSFINRICSEEGAKLLEINDAELFGLADFYRLHHLKRFNIMSKLIIYSFLDAVPRRRYIILQGPYKSGKTSFAYSFTKLFDGVSINVNISKDRLPFYLGSAIGKRYVLFDDVKGKPTVGSNLTHGYGFANLDDLRDYIDGHVEVQLEQKNKQPINQRFPPGMITCNDYVIPPALRERVIGPFKFSKSPLWESHPVNVNSQVLFIGLALSNLLPCSPDVMQHIFTMKSKWWNEHATACNCLVSYGGGFGSSG